MTKTYDVTVENPFVMNVLVTGVREDELGEIVSTWCGDHTKIIV